MKGINNDQFKAVVAIILFYFLIESVGITCPIKFITGISCAGCGMSRAWLSLMHLDYEKAFYFHPLFLLPPIVLLVYLFRKKVDPTIYRWFMGIVVVLFVVVYMYRLFNVNDKIVVFEPQNNILFRLIRQE